MPAKYNEVNPDDLQQTPDVKPDNSHQSDLSQDWIETRRIFEVTANGDRVLKEVTLEKKKLKVIGLEKKEIIDVLLRSFALLAIFIPVLLYFLQEKNEIKKRKITAQVDVYTNITKELHAIVEGNLTAKEIENSTRLLFYDLFPKVVIQGDQNIKTKLYVLKNVIPVYLHWRSTPLLLDSFDIITTDAFLALSYYKDSGSKSYGKWANSLCWHAVNLFDSLKDVKQVLDDEFVKKEPYDTTGFSIRKQYAKEQLKLLNKSIWIRESLYQDMQTFIFEDLDGNFINKNWDDNYFKNLRENQKTDLLWQNFYIRGFRSFLIKQINELDLAMAKTLN
jgi:hypothetical protein